MHTCRYQHTRRTFTAMPLVSVLKEAAVRMVLGTAAVLVSVIYIRDVGTPSSRLTIC